MVNKRQKAFIGAAIGAVANIAGGLIANAQKKREQRRQQREQTRNEGFQQAAAMSQVYADQDYVDEYKNKIVLKNGGTVLLPKLSDRLKRERMFKCGGRRKAGLGNLIGDAGSNISAGISGVGSAVSNIISNQPTKAIVKSQGFSYTKKDGIATSSSSTGGSIGNEGADASKSVGNLGDSIGKLIDAKLNKNKTTPNNTVNTTTTGTETDSTQTANIGTNTGTTDTNTNTNTDTNGTGIDNTHEDIKFRTGGQIRKYPKIVSGGTAIPLPLGNNYYLMKGRKHANGGIKMGPNNSKGLEVEDGEVMNVGNRSIRVFSSLPFLQGESPAQRVLNGENPDRIFRLQELFKKMNNVSNDGKSKRR